MRPSLRAAGQGGLSPRLAGLGLILLALLGISACVTTETGGAYIEKKDPQKTLELSIQSARNYIAQRNWEAAKRHLRIALEIDDHNAEVHETMAEVLWQTGEYEQAELHFQRAVTLDGKNSRIRNNYGAFLYDQKRYPDAEKQLERVTDDLMYDKRPEAFISLGRIELKLKKYKEAKEVLERARLMETNSMQGVPELAEVYFQLGDYDRSKAFYETYRQQMKAQTPASLWLGIRLADKLGDPDAQASYALVLKNLYPRSEEYLEYLSVYGHGRQ